MAHPYPLTIVSGFWQVDNKHGNKFAEWFKTTLRINCPYVIFGTPQSLALVKEHRRGLPTHYVELDISEFHMYQYKDVIETHPVHCPSKELNMIWSEKVFLMQRAVALNVYGSEYFAWVDSGICTYRNSAPPTEPFPNVDRLLTLPKDKFLFTSSDSPVFDANRIGSYYHFVSGTFVIHKDFIGRFVEVFAASLVRFMPHKMWILTDQVLYTLVYYERPELFQCIGHGYGEIMNVLR